MPTPNESSPTPFALTPAQQEMLVAAKTWWQEGERAFDYLAERGQQEALLSRLRPLFDAFRNSPTAATVAPILRLVRQLSANRALNRTLETDDFARALHALLFGGEPIAARLGTFLETQRSVGLQITSHLLYGFAPEQFPFVHAATRTPLALSLAQQKAARQNAQDHYALDAEDMARPVLTLLTDFRIYEAARAVLQVASFLEVNGVLAHTREMPLPAKRRRSPAKAVRESATGYVAGGNEVEAELTETTLVAFIEASIASQGFTFPPLTVRDYYISLKTKPFVILTGLSGTGKTQLTHLFAHALTGSTQSQYLLLPVRPDWADSTALLGYQNVLTNRYVSTPFLSLLTEAARPENRERAFFVCLDEMNLARVEHYFADVLSAMETPDRHFPLHEDRIAILPTNVFLTGSVNIDEATYPFSRKVLDRANTIEFSEVHFAPFTDTAPALSPLPPADPPQERQRVFLAGRVENVQDAQRRLHAIDATFPNRIVALLSELNGLLEPRGMHFGYRVRDEILRYVAAAFTGDGVGILAENLENNLVTALDLQMVQKALPRLSGTAESLDGLLKNVEKWAEAHQFPRTQAKLGAMRRRAVEDGFVTFYEP